jgi:hypothetical protein
MIAHEEKRPGQGATYTGAGITETNCSKPTLTAAQRQDLIAAASQALPVGELDAQAYGSRTAWGTHTRPGRIKARSQAIRALVRAAEIAQEIRPELETRHLATALRSLELRLADVLVDPLTGRWIGTKAAIANRGREIAAALAELALIVRETEIEGGPNL